MDRATAVPDTIVCVDCGGTCHLLGAPESGWSDGDIAPYRCADCHDRWDLVVEGTAGGEEYT